ncbi:protein NUCLEAR FUSION DEFECTIVE 4 [Artemisia annua]|uniref:Protein NUCLEAR FUSION DEFECTIVE 4 n=1 Tax=Artemisia annua TaxID=35608 RepID=A0A2U1LE64_ARTAN|nr:protein NUCLEAR FUSION DEFECTIVE 4 [Artemisia annua]
MGYQIISPTSPAGKWMGFVTAVWVQAISGNNYTFSNYSDALKSLMALTQLQLNNLSVAKDVGKAFGILAGLASDRLSPATLLFIGSVEGFIGYGVQWLVVSQRIQPLPYWQMCIFLCMGGNSTTWMNTAILVTCIRNFRKNRGPVSGILKGYVGLSTAIFTDICAALFSNDPARFLLMLAVVPVFICLFAIIFLREIPPSTTVAEDSSESRYFAIFNVLAVIIAVYLLVFDLTGEHGPGMAVQNNMGQMGLAQGYADVSIFVSLVSIWGFFGRIGSGSVSEYFINKNGGPGMAVQNNMGQMGLAQGYADVSIFVSLVSIWGFFGRIGSGSVSEYFINKNGAKSKAGTPRPLWNAASQILMAVGFILLAIAMPGSLYIGSIVVGICYGIRLAITVPAASELFGLKYYGLIYNILILNLPLGSFLFSGLLAGFLYDAEATTTADGGNTCIGAHCYRLVFIVMAIVSVVGFCLDVWLAIRTKALYTRIYTSRKSKKSMAVSNGH